MSQVPIIAVIGDARVEPGDERDIFAEEVGRLIIDRGWRLQTGGLGGVMESASRGGRSAPRWVSGSIIGILPGWDPAEANPFVDIAIPTGMDHGRNMLVSQADAVVAIGGGAGTLIEIATAWTLFRLVVAMRGPGWAGRLADERVDHRVRCRDIEDDRVYGASTPADAMAIVEARLSLYKPRHDGIRRRNSTG